MKLSVVIPAYNRHELTVRHVEECLKSTRFPDEIIVVNDGGPANLRDLLRTSLATTDVAVPIIYANITEDILWNYNGACNLGFWIASGDIVALEDTDHIPGRTVYEDAVRFFENPANAEIERLAFSRNVLEQSELSKPMEEWTVSRHWGPNDMVSVMKRSLYVRMKGQDERMARNYGYMAYDWKWRMKKLGVKSSKIHGYWAVVGDGGEPGLKRGLSPANRRILHENAHRTDGQYAGGLLNFNYTVEKL